MVGKVLSVEKAVDLIRDGDTVSTTGFGSLGLAEEVLVALEKRFLETGTPRNLTVLHAAGQGDYNGIGIDHLAHEGMLKRVIGGHFGSSVKTCQMVNDGKIEAYNLPQGVICHLYRAIAANKPGEITKVGLNTYVDPRLEGGRLNSRTTKDIVQLIEINGEEWLLYLSMPINVAIIRGTTADELGNVSLEDEAVCGEGLSIAQAAKVSGGKVIVQVKNMAVAGTLDAQMVKIPGILVDAIVVSREPEKYHKQTGEIFFSPVLAGRFNAPPGSLHPIPLDERKVIARRAAMELNPGAVVNLGLGMPEKIASVSSEEGIADQVVLTVEAGLTGGIPLSGPNFGAALNPWAIIEQTSQFDFYDGGGLDIAFLGMAQVSRRGDVNVSRFGAKIAGCGGFINISQNTRKVVFCGKFVNGKTEYGIGGGELRIIRDGNSKKFIGEVEQITFSGEYACRNNQVVLYVTERAVFSLDKEGLVLREIAPGVDIERDVLGQMGFRPRVAKDLRLMDTVIFSDKPLALGNFKK